MADDKKTIREKIAAFFEREKIDLVVIDAPKSKERLDKLVAFSKDKTIELKCEALPLMDGMTEMTAEPAFEVGAACVITTKEGTIPAPVGKYELQDGRVVVVAEEGIIAEIQEKAADGEPPVDEPMAADKELTGKIKSLIERVETEKHFEKVSESANKIAALESKLAKSDEAYKKLSEEFTKLHGITKDIYEMIGDEPKKEPVVKTLSAFAKEKKQNMFQPKFDKKD